MANDYVTVVEIKDALADSGNQLGSTYDTRLGRTAARASRLFDRETNREPGAYYSTAGVVRYFKGSGDTRQFLDEFTSITTLAVAESGDVDYSTDTGGDYTTWAASDYRLLPNNAPKFGEPYFEIEIDVLNGSKSIFYAYEKGLKITAAWGFSTTAPVDVVEAVTEIAVNMFHNGQMAYARGAANAGLGVSGRVAVISPNVQDIIAVYRRMAV